MPIQKHKEGCHGRIAQRLHQDRCGKRLYLSGGRQRASGADCTAFSSTSRSPAKCCTADRMPPIPADKFTPEQKKASDDFAAERKTPVFGPFVPLLRSPEVMLRAKAMGRLPAL
jgi:hypothetical protein